MSSPIKVTKKEFLADVGYFVDASKNGQQVEIRADDDARVLAVLGWGELPSPTEGEEKLKEELDRAIQRCKKDKIEGTWIS